MDDITDDLFDELTNSEGDIDDEMEEEFDLFEDLSESELESISSFEISPDMPQLFEEQVIYKVPGKEYKSLSHNFSEEEIFDKFLSELVYG